MRYFEAKVAGKRCHCRAVRLTEPEREALDRARGRMPWPQWARRVLLEAAREEAKRREEL